MSVDLSISLTNNVFPSVFQDAILQSDPPMSRASHKNTDYSDTETAPMRSDSHRGLIWRLLADRGFGMQNRLLERYAAVTPQIHEIIGRDRIGECHQLLLGIVDEALAVQHLIAFTFFYAFVASTLSGREST